MSKTLEHLLNELTTARRDCAKPEAIAKLAEAIDAINPLDSEDHRGIVVEFYINGGFNWTEYGDTAARALEVADEGCRDSNGQHVSVNFSLLA